MSKKKIMMVFGTRPEAIKMCPLYLALISNESFDTRCLVTAQHREMLDGILETFGVTPDYDLNLMSQQQTVSSLTQKILFEIDPILEKEKPDLVLVHGDTTTAFSAALACFYRMIPVGHVEAGMRSYERYSPYPEEMNRSLISDLATLHFAPTNANKNNLLKERIREDSIFVTGNTCIDALRIKAQDDSSIRGIPGLDLAGRRTILLTCHRREALGNAMLDIFSAVGKILRDYPDTQVVFPIHKNPKVRETFALADIHSDRLKLIEPVDYPTFIWLMKHSHIVVTDSGGIQEEAPYFGRPVVVVRDVTERMEAVLAGTVVLAGTHYRHVYGNIAALLDDEEHYHAMSRAVNPYGDGHACDRIIDALSYHFGIMKDEPKEFGG